MDTTNRAIQFNNHFLCFTLAGEECGIPMPRVKKLVLYKNWSSFKTTPDYQDGVFIHQKRIIPLLDLRRFLGVGERRKGSLASVIINDINGDIYGVIVDGITDTVHFEKNMIDFETPLLSDFNTDYIYGIVSHGKSNVILLRLDRIITEHQHNNKPALAAVV